ncbi:MAG: pyrroline-5-carboxylate reductase [Eubacterium pyruvativorans]|nr:pyrroline-5-carboxylate reductase [Eubacterium pyruvativorans]MDD6707353.1 pyrroline-5-carboxylate reductase [Eubacterium pyruvativorans]
MKLGFIGCGVMANAMMGGIIKNGLLKPEEIWGADPFEGSRQKTKEQNGIHVTESNLEVIENCDVVFLTIKPQYYADAIASFRDHVREDQMFISIGAGRTLDYIAEQFENKPVKVVRVMPNTPAQVAEGMSAACPNQYVTEEETQTALTILRAFGKAELMPESLFDVVTGVSGSGPAYVCMFIEAMADAAVLGGMQRSQAYTLAEQTVLGTAKMLMETGLHPGVLKDMVSSPAGTTIAAVRKLEEEGLRRAVIEGVNACTEKSIQMQSAK